MRAGAPRPGLRLQSIDDVLLLLPHGVHRRGVVALFLRSNFPFEPLRRRRLLAVPRSVGLEDGVPLDGVAVAIMPRVPRVAVDARAPARIRMRRRRRPSYGRGAFRQGRRGVADLSVVRASRAMIARGTSKSRRAERLPPEAVASQSHLRARACNLEGVSECNDALRSVCTLSITPMI